MMTLLIIGQMNSITLKIWDKRLLYEYTLRITSPSENFIL